MRKRTLLAVSAAVVLLTASAWAETLPRTKPEQVGLSSERLEHVSRVLRNEIEKGKVPGAVALVAGKGRIAYFDGYTFGLGFSVRKDVGLAGQAGSIGEYGWAGAGGTYFWIDPKELVQQAVVD